MEHRLPWLTASSSINNTQGNGEGGKSGGGEIPRYRKGGKKRNRGRVWVTDTVVCMDRRCGRIKQRREDVREGETDEEGGAWRQVMETERQAAARREGCDRSPIDV